MTRADARVAELAVSQLGLVSRSQAKACGFSDGLISARVRTGAWKRVAPGVYEVLRFPDGLERALWRAHLAAGQPAVVAHEAAAELRGIPGFRRGVISLLVPFGDHHRVVGARIRQTRDRWEEVSWSTVGGLPVTTPARTFVDLAGISTRARLRHGLDEAIAMSLVTTIEVADCLRAVARPGKPGVGVLAQVLDDLGPGWAPSQSTLERRFFELLRRFDEPRPQRQYPLPGRQVIRGLVDAAYVDAKLIIEVDGRRWHTRVQDLRRDHERDAEAARAGWLVLRVLYEHVRHDPHGTVERIRDTRLIRSPLAVPTSL